MFSLVQFSSRDLILINEKISIPPPRKMSLYNFCHHVQSNISLVHEAPHGLECSRHSTAWTIHIIDQAEEPCRTPS